MTTRIFDGTLTVADHKGHVPVRFDVPEGTTRLVGRFSTEPRRATGAGFDNMVCLTIEGPAGVRGARHNNPERDFVIDAAEATPGYVPGAIEPGAWTVWMDGFRILGPDPVHWRLEIDCRTDAVAPAVPAAAPLRPAKGPGWYKGDLHAHTFHSDSSLSPADLADAARRAGLDFATLTDHNTVSALAAVERLADADLLTMGGVELTTHHGHALVLGTRNWMEWRAGSLDGVTMPAIAQAAHAAGHPFVIAHPMSPGDPSCTGCRWEFADMRPGPARLVEVWNGPWSAYNEEGLALFHRWLDEGHRLRATAGTDLHRSKDALRANGFNHVHAQSLTEGAVLAGLAAGRNYLSSGPRLVATAGAADGTPVAMGGSVAAGRPVHLEWAGADGLDLVTVVDGRRADPVPVRGAGGTWLDAQPERWVMAELRDGDGRLHAVTNPIFVD
jgi:hypothetical protein